MKVLVIGSGGREHAIAYKLKQSPKVTELYAIPGNPGIASLGTCVPGSVEDNEFIVDFIKKNQIDLTVIGPEVPLCKGLADDIEKAGYKAFGPQKKAATLEGSKAYSKDFMVRHHIPTAKYIEVTDFEKACKEVDHFDFPLVIKADGLAAGKGVVIVENKEDAISTLKEMMVDGALDGAGSKVVLEEFLTGFVLLMVKQLYQWFQQKIINKSLTEIKDLIQVVWELFLQIHFYQKVWTKS